MGPPRHFFVRDCCLFPRHKTWHQAAKKLRFASKRAFLREAI
jgi:hypothetical protein